MKTLSAPILSAVLSAALLGACAVGPPPAPLTVTATPLAQNAQAARAAATTVEVAPGQALNIALPLNAGTGYAWRLDQEAPDSILSGGSSRITDTDRPGGPVQTIFAYKAVARGAATLSFTLKRPWEPDAADDAKAVFKIKVR